MTLNRFIKPTLLALAAASFALSAQAAPLKVDAAKSNVVATFKQLNVPVDAKFKKFAATIDFDAAKPAEGKANVEIDVTSFDLGEPDYNKEVQKKEWFNAAQFPKASFVSSSIKANGAGKYDVAGKLTIKGKTTDVSFPLTVKKEGAAQVFDGVLPIKRLTYNIGEGEWKDTGMVADEVTIKFHIVAQ
ncbi:YceI family protein [Herbaspirillum seropedicae]|uniref:Signal peptide protein n=1 Tax=Herbaspirillum seropedicae (strain SmR1) TaxID=757424 RepID=D8IZ83_HERSS|nr:YceI family protein [Herbaspirillum seropedicae]ADJ62203.1 signal peptide protein [Herbaspirillum seropedicae SmR1]AKN64365.1 polyisoprenoid-binding protein [Herbaspirillum seropedicae]AON52990.1 signal peptide protein [Herbaspirillum seropedicae]NQE27769.1 polyisoprenoid-binding protein [Herbaspirillum seropedicae]QDD63309.1 YceI family protein [Herbaspirillum seropedicae]